MNPLDLITYPGTYDDLPPPTVPYYIATNTGPFIHKKTSLGTILAPVKRIDGLPTMDEEYSRGTFWWEAPKIPARLMGQATRWFTHIWDTMKTEAALLITYNPDDERKYRLFVPPQEVGPASVNFEYDAAAIQPGWAVVGSLHSHCNFGCHHSGTDTKDATEIPGIHITIGHVDTQPEYDVFVGLHDIEFAFDYKTVCEDPDMTAEPPAWWDAYVIKKTYATTKTGKWQGYRASEDLSIWDDYDPYRYWPAWQKDRVTNILTLPPAKKATLEDILSAYDHLNTDADLHKTEPLAAQIRREMRIIQNIEERLRKIGVELDWTLDESVDI